MPLYDTLGEDAVRYEINHAWMITVVVVEKAKLKNVAAVAAGDTLRVVVQIEVARRGAARDRRARGGGRHHRLGGAHLSGAQHEQPVDAPLGSDLAFIMYTSGTTGDPKGALCRQPTAA